MSQYIRNMLIHFFLLIIYQHLTILIKYTWQHNDILFWVFFGQRGFWVFFQSEGLDFDILTGLTVMNLFFFSKCTRQYALFDILMLSSKWLQDPLGHLAVFLWRKLQNPAGMYPEDASAPWLHQSHPLDLGNTVCVWICWKWTLDRKISGMSKSTKHSSNNSKTIVVKLKKKKKYLATA